MQSLLLLLLIIQYVYCSRGSLLHRRLTVHGRSIVRVIIDNGSISDNTRLIGTIWFVIARATRSALRISRSVGVSSFGRGLCCRCFSIII